MVASGRNGWIGRCVCAVVALCCAAGVRGDIGTNYGNWSNYGTWGYCYTATYGQTFRGNGEFCTGFRFRFYSGSCCSSWPFRAILMRWDGANARAIGPVLAQTDAGFGNYGCCWFDREVAFASPVGLESGTEYVVFFTVTPWWGSYGCRDASFAVTPQGAYQDGRMYVLSNGSSTAAWTQSTWSETGYDIEFAVRTDADCDDNGIVDSAEIASGALADCDGNGFADICEQLAPESAAYASEDRGPIGASSTVSHTFESVLPARGDVALEIDALADLSSTHEFLLVSVSGGPAHPVFTGTEADCGWNTQSITIPRDEFNAAIAKNALTVSVSASPTVDPLACEGLSAVRVRIAYTEAFPDCNGNFVSDAADFCSLVSLDCNDNRRPDECDIAAGSSNDIDADGVPDECQPDCNNDGRPDAFQIFVGEEPDCNANALPDECDLYAGGASVDCNGNGTPDECDIASGVAPDCDGDGKIDSCSLSQGLVPDCNGNGVPDSCDIASGVSQDCDGNALPDSCEVAALGYTDFYSPQRSVSVNQPFTYQYAGARPSTGDVYMEVYYYLYADYGYGRPARVLLDGVEVYSWADNYWGCCCSNNRGFSVSRDVWNQVASDGEVECRVTTQSDCGGAYARLRFAYTRLPLAPDCNSNGVPDACDLTSGFDHDCNGNGQLDACDITQGAEDDNLNGYPDPCELDRGDLNLDGEVNGADLAILLSYWGGVGYPIGDCNHDGIIAGADLAILLTNWGEPI